MGLPTFPVDLRQQEPICLQSVRQMRQESNMNPQYRCDPIPSLHLLQPPYLRSGKTDNGRFKQGPFCLIKMDVFKQCSPLRYGIFRSLRGGKFVFQKSLSETPFELDRVGFCTSNSCCSVAMLYMRLVDTWAMAQPHRWPGCLTWEE